MRRVTEFLAANAAELMFGLTLFLIVYLIARLLKASPVMALSFAALPLAIAYVMLNPNSPARLLAALS